MTKTYAPTKPFRCTAVIVLAFVLLVGTGGWTTVPKALSSPAPLLPCSLAPSPPHPPAPPPPGIVEPALARALAHAGPQDTLRVIVYLQEQPAPEAVVAGAPSVTEAHSRLVETLQTTAARSQAPLRAYLAKAQATGLVESYTPFWIVNGIAVHANRDAISVLTTRPEVVTVRLDHYRQWLPIIPTRSDDFSRYYRQERLKSLLHTQIEWGIERIRADDVWHTLHISGTGTVVAGMDTGVDWLHPALQANYRGYNPHGPSNHIYSWCDATGGGALYPVDGHGHGSHTLGTIAGQEGIGVAPGARWIGVKVLNSQGYGYDSWIHEGFQWLLAPGGDPAQAPDVINCSWGNSNGHLTTFQPDLQALRAAGILAVFANGNKRPRRGHRRLTGLPARGLCRWRQRRRRRGGRLFQPWPVAVG